MPKRVMAACLLSFGWALLAFVWVSTATAQNWNNGYNQYRLSSDDQRRFDDYYSKWLQNRQRRDRSEIASMEMRMLDIYGKYRIPSSTPYDALASRNVETPGGGNYAGRLRGDDQSRFDNYYKRWLSYRQSRDREQIASMQGRMLDIYSSNRIPLTTPYEMVASASVLPGGGGVAPPWGPGGSGGDLRILQAVYGAAGRQMNVTNRIQSMVNNGSVNVAVNNGTMGGDPAPGIAKQLFVSYSYRGQQQSTSVAENDNLTIPGGYVPGPGNGNGLRFLQASYGAAGRQMNVVGRLQSMAGNGTISVRVNNDSMGGDPAQGTPKQLYVVYNYRGQQRSATVPENGVLQIP
jgi:hypothetical protein